ncbi:hypothetical protein MU516_17930 [Paracoccus sp. YLB-12]|uniref:Uncharacterized protein n=1 Tax=Paracoccus maritimus TaxID=2933292 RepID=A0ABT2KFS3_9RHOB|nr:hypothetical protein [Paracoccus sp. YLB-12]MCT4334730.1 hypothetical protein [Paracoccus sp. YLB-12]
MTPPKTRLIGATAITALALAGALVAWQASSDSPADLAQLSDDDKLEILNSGDADAISELLEAEEAAAQAHFARERLERQKREAEIDVERAETKARGAAYWDSFDPDSIDLTGFDFAMTDVLSRDERRAILDEASFARDFERASSVTFARSTFDCNSTRFAGIRQLLKDKPDLPLSVDQGVVFSFLNYLASRAALETGDCSCATQHVPPELGWELAERLSQHPSASSISDVFARKNAMQSAANLFFDSLDGEAREFCKKG